MEFISRNEKFLGKSSNNVTPIGSIILDLPPSCVEFVPPHDNLTWPINSPCFVVGTYDLQKEENERVDEEEVTSSVPKEQSRQGSLSLFAFKNGQLNKIQEVLTPSAILDLHFFPESSTFAVASSTGSVSFYKVQATQVTQSDASEIEYTITPVITHQLFEKDVIITSFAWDPAFQENGPRMVVTCNDGGVKLLKFNETFMEFEILNDGEPLCQHEYEAWCAVFSTSSEKILSGGDDSKLLISQIPPNFIPPATIRGHNAGVTAILPLPTNTADDETPIILTGSYDDHIRVMTLPSALSPRSKILAELDIGLGGGGVWKLKLSEGYRDQNDRLLISTSLSTPGNARDSEKDESSDVKKERGEEQEEEEREEITYRVLACCMRVGAKIVEIKRDKDGDWSIKVLAVVGVHESMCYASDVVPIISERSAVGEGGELEKRVIVSTSFYDRLLFVWRWDPSVIDVKGLGG